MQTDLDTLSRENRRKLNKQIRRVQAEARRLRAQARQLRRAQHEEEKKRKKLLQQLASASKEWSQSVLRRGGELTAAAGSQLISGKQVASKRGKEILQGRGSLLADWQNRTAQQLDKYTKSGARTLREQAERGRQWRYETARQLRQQGEQLTRQATDWKDETAYKLRRQGLGLRQSLIVLGDEITCKLLHQGQYLMQSLAKRSEGAAQKLHKQEHEASRRLAARKAAAALQVRKQELQMRQELARRRREAARHAGKPSRFPGSRIWPVLGFVSGLLVAGGVTYWLVKRNFGREELKEEEEHIELTSYETLDGVSETSGGETRRYSRRGGAAVASEPGTRFIGVLSSRKYYPAEQAPDVQDVVFFETENDARAEGFTAGL